MGLFKSLFGDASSRELKSIYPIVDQIEALSDEYKALTDAQLQAKTVEFKERLANGETLDDILPDAFAACREAAVRTVGMKPDSPLHMMFLSIVAFCNMPDPSS